MLNLLHIGHIDSIRFIAMDAPFEPLRRRFSGFQSWEKMSLGSHLL
jgi:hypothetical protein